MNKLFYLFAAALLVAAYPTGASAQLKIGGKKLNAGKLLSAGKDVAKAITLSDDDIARLSRESVEWMDAHNPVADDSTSYGARLKRLTEGITEVDGLPLNFKVYLVVDVNAFACGDGSIRVFAALMDLMDDDELMAILEMNAGRQGYRVAEAAKAVVCCMLTQMTLSERMDFGNARGMRNTLEKLVQAQANRLAACEGEVTRDMLEEITEADAKAALVGEEEQKQADSENVAQLAERGEQE